MIPIDLSGKVALVTGVGDNKSFAWFISKWLVSAGATVALASYPRVVGMVETFLTSARDDDRESRVLPTGGELKVAKVVPCDASYDTAADVPANLRDDRKWKKFFDDGVDFSIQGAVESVGKEFGKIDILIHSVALSREIKNAAKDTSRLAYLEALGVSAYSLTSMLRYAEPFMAPGSSAVGLTYVGGERVVPYYGGGMATAKAALQIDAKQLAQNYGPKNIRVNLVSAGPYASRAATAIQAPGQMEKSIDYAASKSPLQRAITPDEVANATLFLVSDMASAVTGQILYVDCGYNIMAV